jgi:tRNA (cmo5U34)-methyltransferase
MTQFSDPQAIADYAERTRGLVPGLVDLHRMSALLLSERAPLDGRVLVVGAGGGLELKAFAESQPDWRLEGVDPSAEMLDLARANSRPAGPARRAASRLCRCRTGRTVRRRVVSFDAALH